MLPAPVVRSMSGRHRIERALSRQRSQSAPPVNQSIGDEVQTLQVGQRTGNEQDTPNGAAKEEPASSPESVPTSDAQSVRSEPERSNQSIETQSERLGPDSVFDKLEAKLEVSKITGSNDIILHRSHCLLLLQEARRLQRENEDLQKVGATLPPAMPGQQAVTDNDFGPGSPSVASLGAASPGATSPGATSPRNTSSRATSPLALTFKSAARAVVWSSQLRYASLQNENAHRAALLPKALAMFVPLHDYPRVTELVDGSRHWRSVGTDAASQRRPSLLALEQRVVADAHNETALLGLQERVQAIFVAYSAIVAEQMRSAAGQRETISPRRRIALDGEEGAKLWRRQLGKVIAAGSDYFESVYNSVYVVLCCSCPKAKNLLLLSNVAVRVYNGWNSCGCYQLSNYQSHGRSGTSAIRQRTSCHSTRHKCQPDDTKDRFGALSTRCRNQASFFGAHHRPGT